MLLCSPYTNSTYSALLLPRWLLASQRYVPLSVLFSVVMVSSWPSTIMRSMSGSSPPSLDHSTDSGLEAKTRERLTVYLRASRVRKQTLQATSTYIGLPMETHSSFKYWPSCGMINECVISKRGASAKSKTAALKLPRFPETLDFTDKKKKKTTPKNTRVRHCQLCYS